MYLYFVWNFYINKTLKEYCSKKRYYPYTNDKEITSEIENTWHIQKNMGRRKEKIQKILGIIISILQNIWLNYIQ